MEDKLTGKDFLAVIGILTIAGIAYMFLQHREKREKKNAGLVAGGLVFEQIPLSKGVYAPSNVLDGYMQLYDTSEARTIGTIDMVVIN